MLTYWGRKVQFQLADFNFCWETVARTWWGLVNPRWAAGTSPPLLSQWPWTSGKGVHVAHIPGSWVCPLFKNGYKFVNVTCTQKSIKWKVQSRYFYYRVAHTLVISSQNPKGHLCPFPGTTPFHCKCSHFLVFLVYVYRLSRHPKHGRSFLLRKQFGTRWSQQYILSWIQLPPPAAALCSVRPACGRSCPVSTAAWLSSAWLSLHCYLPSSWRAFGWMTGLGCCEELGYRYSWHGPWGTQQLFPRQAVELPGYGNACLLLLTVDVKHFSKLVASIRIATSSIWDPPHPAASLTFSAVSVSHFSGPDECVIASRFGYNLRFAENQQNREAFYKCIGPRDIIFCGVSVQIS